MSLVWTSFNFGLPELGWKLNWWRVYHNSMNISLIHLDGSKPFHSSSTMEETDVSVPDTIGRQRYESIWSFQSIRALSRTMRLIHSCQLVAQSSKSRVELSTWDANGSGTKTPSVFVVRGEDNLTVGWCCDNKCLDDSIICQHMWPYICSFLFRNQPWICWLTFFNICPIQVMEQPRQRLGKYILKDPFYPSESFLSM